MDEARSTLIEEQKARVDNTPYGHALVLLHKMAYDNPINQRTGYGDVDVLKSITAEEAMRFHDAYYTPSNTALALVGDFDPKQARERIEHYFGSIPQRSAPPPLDAREPGRAAEARATITDATARAPQVMIAWRIPPPSDPDWFVLFALGNLLAGNQTSRFQSTLIKGSGVATDMQFSPETNSGANLLLINLVGAPGKDLAQVEAAAYQEIDRIGREGVPQGELDRMWTDQARQRAMSLVTTNYRGLAFARVLSTSNHPEGLNEWMSQARKVTSESLQRIVKKYFTPANRTVLYVYPPGGGSK
jgi:predicted Zn-dependent peptidase